MREQEDLRGAAARYLQLYNDAGLPSWLLPAYDIHATERARQRWVQLACP